MLELPAELHLRIAECLSQADLFNFRLSCKTLSSPGHSVLFSPQKASHLYIHPTTIQQFIDICHDDAFAAKVTTVIVLGDFMIDLEPSRKSKSLCHLPWPRSEGNDPTAASPSEKAPFRTAYMRVLAATRNLSNLQKIAYTTCALQPGLNSTSEIDVTTQARQCPLKAAEDDERPMEWSDTEFILGLALNVPNITHIDADCSFYHLLGDTKSFDLLFPEGKCSKVRKGKKIYGEDWVKEQIFDQLNLQLTSLTYEPIVDTLIPRERSLLGKTLLQCCSSISDVEAVISYASIRDSDVISCLQACRQLNSLCSFRVRILEVEPTLLTVDWCLDDNDPSTRTEVLEYASVFKTFVLQHIKTLEICVVDSIVSTSEYQLKILAEGLKGFSAAGKNARMCLRTYACKPPAVQEGNADLLKALRIVLELE